MEFIEIERHANYALATARAYAQINRTEAQKPYPLWVN